MKPAAELEEFAWPIPVGARYAPQEVIKPSHRARHWPAVRVRAVRLGVALIVAYLLVIGGSAQLELTRLNGQAAALQGQAAQLARQEHVLRAEAARLERPAYVEQLARTQLGYVSPGEVPLVPTASSSAPSAP